MTLRIAVLGAGFQGMCVALELAQRGFEIDLFDEGSEPITRAGLWNEGKIHLGLVYAREPQPTTAGRLIPAAMFFGQWLRATIGADLSRLTSEPFEYAVHRHSGISARAFREHLLRLEPLVERQRRSGADYLGDISSPVFEELTRSDWEQRYDTSTTTTVFRTMERAVDPVAIAGLLRTALKSASGVRFHASHRVHRVSDIASGYGVSVEDGTEFRGYDHVVNCLWAGRLPIDRGVGVALGGDRLFRAKAGLRIVGVPAADRPPTMTIVHGEYGDTVVYPSGVVYASWYPVSRISTSSALEMQDPFPSLPRAQQADIASGVAAGLETVLPGFADAVGVGSTTVGGGVIFAYGATDIDDPESGLHHRHQIGVASHAGYHTIDTGKYTAAPLFAREVADRILGEAAGTRERPPRARA